MQQTSKGGEPKFSSEMATTKLEIVEHKKGFLRSPSQFWLDWVRKYYKCKHKIWKIDTFDFTKLTVAKLKWRIHALITRWNRWFETLGELWQKRVTKRYKKSTKRQFEVGKLFWDCITWKQQLWTVGLLTKYKNRCSKLN